MPTVNVPDELANALFPADPKVQEHADLLLGGTLPLCDVVKKINDQFYDAIKNKKNGTPVIIDLEYEEWRAIRTALRLGIKQANEENQKAETAKNRANNFSELFALGKLNLTWDDVRPKDAK